MVKDLVKMLREKPVLGEFGPWKRPYVVLDVDEYHAILKELTKRRPGRPRKAEVPVETIRA